MPLVRIDLQHGKSASYRREIGTIVYEALTEVLNAPRDDRFQVIAERALEALIADPGYLGITRSPDCVFIQVTLNAGRAVDMKKAFYKRIADQVESRLGMRREDVFINPVEVPKENWSFGNGEAQYA